ncbi:MAG: hypothetical protein CSA95_06970 [Bacteroidetes bacterium]|nr:MAG: hypothetical protein CSA95_06970 [Bacteroidota bacterium]
MKKKNVIGLVLSLLIVSMGVLGQHPNRPNKRPMLNSQREEIPTEIEKIHTISLHEDSKTEEILIVNEASVIRFELTIDAFENAGKLTIELYDPDHVKQGNFTIEKQLSEKKREEVKGHLRKSIVEPKPGEWRIKIIPEKSNGQIKILTKTLILQ